MLFSISYSQVISALAAVTLIFSSSTQAVSVDFSVNGPNLNLGEPVFQQVICQHTFANSFGNPYSTTINAPATKDFSHVFLTMETTTNGTQFDRLAKLFVNGAEIWRTSTSEPAGGNIYYTFTKDVSLYSSLFKIDNVPLTLDLGNIVNDVYTGAFNVQITAKYYKSAPYTAFSSTQRSAVDSFYKRAAPNAVKPLIPADKSATSAFSWSVPNQSPSIKVDALPRNTTRAVVDIFASGNADEEFWYMNFLGNSNSPSQTPARIVTLNIDGDPVGVVLPFPVIYTGGFAPGLWIPVVGINAYDVPSYRIDVTPYLPKLWNGATITLGIDNGLGGACNSEWFVSANLLTWQMSGISGSGQILQGTAHTDKNTFSDPTSNSTVDLMSVARDLSTRAILNFTSSDGSISERAFFTSTQTFSFTNAKNQYTVNGNSYYQIAQISSGYNSFKVSNQGVDLSKYINGQEDDTKAPGTAPVVSDPNPNNDLITVSEESYIYPLAMNYYPSTSNGVYQADINRGYGYDDSYLTVWTKQNGTAFTAQNTGSSISTSNVRSDQYYAQKLVELNGATSSYDQYVATSGHQVVHNSYGNPNNVNLASFGTSDPITSLVSAAARYAVYAKSDKAGVIGAIKNIFDSVLPPIPGRSSSSSTKRSVITEREEKLTTFGRVPSFFSKFSRSIRAPSSISATTTEEASAVNSLNDNASHEKRDTPIISSTAEKVAQYQVGWQAAASNSTLDSTAVCWTCRTECCPTCDCGGNPYIFTLHIPGRTISKRGVKGVLLDAKTAEDVEILKRQATAQTDSIVAFGRNPFFTSSSSSSSSKGHHMHKRVAAADAANDKIVAFGRNPFFTSESLKKEKRDGEDSNVNSTSKWTDAKLLSKAKFWPDANNLFGTSSLCTTCGGGYYGGLSYSFAGSKECSWGSACNGSS